MLLCTYVNLKNQFFISSFLSILSSSLSAARPSLSLNRPWLVSLSLLGRGCRQNGLWWVWVCRRGYGGCGFGFAGVGVGVMGSCRG
jgi:hypothetical protein